MFHRRVLLVWFISSALALGQSSPPSSTASGATTSSATIPIRASDKQGNPVTLSKSSLTVHSGHQQLEILDLKPAKDTPLRFVLLIDLSESDTSKLTFEKKAAQEIFKALSKPGNQGYIGGFNQTVTISTVPMQSPEVSAALAEANAGGGTALYDAISQACDLLAKGADSPSVRRLLILITDGEDNQSHVTPSEAAKLAERAGVSIFALGFPSRYLSPIGQSGGPSGVSVLKKFANDTGGNFVWLEKSTDFLEPLLQPLDSQYFLTFKSAPVPAGKTRDLDIKSADRSVKLFAPSAYATH